MMHEPIDPFEANPRPPATPEWFVTFADMMSLLLALFVMLASFSEVREEERFRAMTSSLRDQFGRAAETRSTLDSIDVRDPRLAAAINSARTRRAALLHVDLRVAISDSPAASESSP